MEKSRPSSQLPIPVPKYLQEDGLTQEWRDLLSSLPTEEGWFSKHIHLYQGFWFESRHIQGVLASHQHFQAHDTDVLLVTYPKAGTTWLKAMVFALLNRVSFPDSQHHPLLTKNPHELVPNLDRELYDGNLTPDLTSFTAPRLFSTHVSLSLMPKSVNISACKLIYLCRNPKDTFVSSWHFANKLRPKDKESISLDEAFDKFCRGVSPFGPFWDHVSGYWKGSLEKPQQVFFLKYEDMKTQPNVQLRRLAEFLGCPFSPEEETRGLVNEILRLCSFDNLCNLEVNKNGKLPTGEQNRVFFRRGEVGDWVNYLTAEMVDRLDHITEEKLHTSGLKFEVVS